MKTAILGGKCSGGQYACVEVRGVEVAGGLKFRSGQFWMLAGELRGTGVVDTMLRRLERSGKRHYRSGTIRARWLGA